MRLVPGLLLCAAMISPGGAAEPAGYIGAEACGACHRAQFAAQSQSGHARSLHRAAEHPLAKDFDGIRIRLRDSFQYGLSLRENALVLDIRNGDDRSEQVADWAFGAGQQAVTFVSRLNEDVYAELRASFYPGHGLALTPGHQNQRPDDAADAVGVHYRIFSPRSEILSCFGCHSTGSLSLEANFAVRPAELGVRCESCHGPGKRHSELVSEAKIGDARQAIVNPARLDASAQMTFCGGCHRPPASEDMAIDWANPWNVRHQPLYLTRSACFQQSAGALNCQTCHDPHEALRRNDPSYYNSRCTTCHSANTRPPAQTCRLEAACASCHMPAVQPQPELTFHNHWIGVYAAGDSLRPQR